MNCRFTLAMLVLASSWFAAPAAAQSVSLGTAGIDVNFGSKAFINLSQIEADAVVIAYQNAIAAGASVDSALIAVENALADLQNNADGDAAVGELEDDPFDPLFAVGIIKLLAGVGSPQDFVNTFGSIYTARDPHVAWDINLQNASDATQRISIGVTSPIETITGPTVARTRYEVELFDTNNDGIARLEPINQFFNLGGLGESTGVTDLGQVLNLTDGIFQVGEAILAPTMGKVVFDTGVVTGPTIGASDKLTTLTPLMEFDLTAGDTVHIRAYFGVGKTVVEMLDAVIALDITTALGVPEPGAGAILSLTGTLLIRRRQSSRARGRKGDILLFRRPKRGHSSFSGRKAARRFCFGFLSRIWGRVLARLGRQVGDTGRLVWLQRCGRGECGTRPTATSLGLPATLRGRGRPRKAR